MRGISTNHVSQQSVVMIGLGTGRTVNQISATTENSDVTV